MDKNRPVRVYRIWPLIVTIVLLLAENGMLQFEISQMRKTMNRTIDLEMTLTKAVTNVAGGVKNNTQSILKLEDVASHHTDSINSIMKAMYVIWRRKP